MELRTIKNPQGSYSVFVDGRWCEIAEPQGVLENTNPSDLNHIFGNVSESSQAFIEEACRAAARDVALWTPMGPLCAPQATARTIELIQENSDRLAKSLTREVGKTNAAARQEVDECLALLSQETAGPKPISGLSAVRTQGGGRVVAIITPFSAPLVIPAVRVLDSLLGGNAVLWSPSPHSPETSQVLMQILWDALQQSAQDNAQELPLGVLSLLLGHKDTASQLLKNPQIQAVEFTGSLDAGAQIQEASESSGKEISLHCYGPNQLYVHESADLDKAARRFLAAITQSAGQGCTAAQDLLCDHAVYDALLERVIELAAGVVMAPAGSETLDQADGDDSAFSLPPVISKAAQRACLKLVSDAVEAGASILYQQEIPGELSRAGFYVPFTLLGGVSPDNVAYATEIMGPIGVVAQVSGVQEALAVINKKKGRIAAIAAGDATVIESFENQWADTAAFWTN
jgi:aldehyde dehydrogenase (NAD+)